MHFAAECTEMFHATLRITPSTSLRKITRLDLCIVVTVCFLWSSKLILMARVISINVSRPRVNELCWQPSTDNDSSVPCFKTYLHEVYSQLVKKCPRTRGEYACVTSVLIYILCHPHVLFLRNFPNLVSLPLRPLQLVRTMLLTHFYKSRRKRKITNNYCRSNSCCPWPSFSPPKDDASRK